MSELLKKHNVIAFDDNCDGVHLYFFQKAIGDPDKGLIYLQDGGDIQFAEKRDDGSIDPGVNDEQLLTVLIDRTEKVNEKLPCKENETTIKLLKEALYHFESKEVRKKRGLLSGMEKYHVELGVNTDGFGGVHHYYMRQNTGSFFGEIIYLYKMNEIKFFQKECDGILTPGITNGQVLAILIDRNEKLNAKFPCKQNENAIKSLKETLSLFERRVEDCKKYDKDFLKIFF